MTVTHSPRSGIVTLLTDFGLADTYVGIMKGVMLNIARDLTLVDLTHDIPRHSTRAGAYGLAGAANYFPPGTVHLVVVDPGVGSRRRAIVAECEHGIYVAPDNGVLTLALRTDKLKRCVAIENHAYRLSQVSMTFHGRDIFAPAAAHLARGLDVAELGPQQQDLAVLELPEAERAGRERVTGEILHVDHFGNCITNIPNAWLFECPSWILQAADTRLRGIQTAYAQVGEGEPLAIWGSSGYLEIAVRAGSASAALGLGVGDVVTATADIERA